jgi:hypothetical protein
MPLPKPNMGESRKDFVSRCMGDNVMNDEYPKEKQRVAVCESLYDNKDKKSWSDLEPKSSIDWEDDKTNFPKKGDNKKISLRNSNFPQFDYAFAERIKEDHNDIFNKGGNEYGDTAFVNWGKVRKTSGTPNTEGLKKWLRRRESFMARHEKDKNIAGVVAVMKWGGIVSRGEKYMKDLIKKEIEKKS